MSLVEPGRDAVRLGVVDAFIVTRVAPHFDADGELKGWTSDSSSRRSVTTKAFSTCTSSR